MVGGREGGREGGKEKEGILEKNTGKTGYRNCYKGNAHGSFEKSLDAMESVLAIGFWSLVVVSRNLFIHSRQSCCYILSHSDLLEIFSRTSQKRS
jgi:hypothetical protein